MKNIFYFLVLAIVFSEPANGQREEITSNWKTICINDSSLGEIKYHAYKNKINDRKPRIV